MMKTILIAVLTGLLLSGCSSTRALKGTLANQVYTAPDGSFHCQVPYQTSDRPKIYDNFGFVSFTSLSSTVVRIDYDNYATNGELVEGIKRKGVQSFLAFELGTYERLILNRYYGGGQKLHEEALTTDGKPMHFASYLISDPERRNERTRCAVLIYLADPQVYHITVFCRPSHNFLFHDASEEQHQEFMKDQLLKMYHLMDYSPPKQGPNK